jgi:hypothetical protein
MYCLLSQYVGAFYLCGRCVCLGLIQSDVDFNCNTFFLVVLTNTLPNHIFVTHNRMHNIKIKMLG